MANYCASARTSYFKVRDLPAFELELQPLEVKIVHHDKQPELIAVFSDDEGGWPCWYIDEETDVDVEIDMADLIGRHLADDHVAVLIEAGAENLRYISGFAIAVNHRGERRQIHLSDIYELARELGPNVTEATY